MAYYYFLMAQLPAVLPSTKPVVCYEEYYELALRYLNRRDRKILEDLTLDPPRNGKKSASSVVEAWYGRERALRLALLKLRAANANRNVTISMDETEDLSGRISVSQAARNAVGMDNPLEAERYLIGIRRLWLEELRGNHFFDSEAVFLYGLTLLLHERGDLFTVEAGQDAYETIYTQILGEEA